MARQGEGGNKLGHSKFNEGSGERRMVLGNPV